MTTDAQPPTAKIYQFPIRIGGTPPAIDQKPRSPDRTAPRPRSDFGSGWYHDAAINTPDGSRRH